MTAIAAIQEQLKVAEAQEAKARAEQMGLEAALGRCRAVRAMWARAAHLRRLQLAWVSFCDRLGLPVPRRPLPATTPTPLVAAAAQPPRMSVGNPRPAGCFQCRFLARGGAVGRRGGRAHTCGGPASAEYQHWARVRITQRALTLGGGRVPVKVKKGSASVPVKRKTKRVAGSRR